jgi:hypothetical protein
MFNSGGCSYYHFPVEHYLFTVAGRAYAFVFFKDAVQMAFISKMQFKGNLVNAHIAVQQPGFYQL